MVTEAVLGTAGAGGEARVQGTDPDGAETSTFPVYKETDGWEKVSSSWRSPLGQLSPPAPPMSSKGYTSPSNTAHSRFPVQPFNRSSDCYVATVLWDPH